jgi:oligopeptide transport system substrate-binding protein
MTKTLNSFFLALSLALSLSACTSGNKANDTSRTMQLAIGDDVKSLDPALAYDSVSLTVMPLAMESLFQYKYLKRPLELEPLLAESMPVVSKDGKKVTIKVKKGVRFQDDPAFPEGKGRELTAHDFIYAWKRMLLPKIQSPGTWIFDGKVLGWDDYRKKLVEAKDNPEAALQEEVIGLKAIDSHTIEFQLLRPYPQLVHVLAMGFGAPVAKEVAQKYGHDGLNQRMVGTGPFMLKDFVKGSKIVVVKNPNFRGETYPSEGDAEAQGAGLLQAAGKSLPFVDGIHFSIIKEDQPAWLQFQKGNLDASGIPKDNFSGAIASGQLKPEFVEKGIQLLRSEEAVIWYLNFNMKDKVVGGKNADLRRAISMALNREEFIEKFLNGRGVKATSMVPRVIAGHTGRDQLVNDFNVEKAKELLEKAGYPGGKGLPVIKYDLRGPSTTARQQGEYFKKSLEAIGVNIEVVSNTFPAYLEKEKNGNLQFFMGGWSADFPDAENFMFLLHSKNVAPGPNSSNYVNPAYDKLYERIAAMAPSPERDRLIKQAEEIVFNDGIWSMLFYPVRYSLYHSWLKNYRPNAQILNDVKYWDVDVAQRMESRKKL